MSRYRILAGSYAPAEAEGIRCFDLDTDACTMTPAGGVSGVSNPSYLAASDDGRFVYAVMEDMMFAGQFGGGVAALTWQGDALRLLNCQPTGGTLPCHVLLDEAKQTLYVGNYMSGSLSAFALNADGSLKARIAFDQHSGHGVNPDRQEGPHVHFCGFAPDGSGFYCNDLGLDTVFFYRADAAGVPVHDAARDIRVPGGAGPRHFATHPDFPDRLFLLFELASEVAVVKTDVPGGRVLQRLSTLADKNVENICAAVKFSPDGRYLYASSRGEDSIAVMELQPDGLLRRVQVCPSGGCAPRDILVLDDLLLAANQDSNVIVGFARDKQTGQLSGPVLTQKMSAPVCLIKL